MGPAWYFQRSRSGLEWATLRADWLATFCDSVGHAGADCCSMRQFRSADIIPQLYIHVEICVLDILHRSRCFCSIAGHVWHAYGEPVLQLVDQPVVSPTTTAMQCRSLRRLWVGLFQAV